MTTQSPLPKDRSPNFPAVPLKDAVKWAKTLWDDARKNVVPVEAVAKATGSEAKKGVSGPTRSKIAAMRQYGLIDTVGQGSYRLSTIGIDLAIHNADDPEYKTALKRAALSPARFGEMYAKYEDLPSEHILSVSLQKESNFSEDGAKRFIRAFKETLSLAGLDQERYTPANGGEPNEENSSRNQGEAKPPHFQHPPAGGKAVAYSWPLGGGNKVELGFVNEPTRAQLDVMLAQLKIMREVAPVEEAVADPDGGE